MPNDGTPELVFYGLLSRDIDRIVEFFLTADEAERVRSDVLRDEPDWATSLEVVRVDFGRGAVVEPAAKH
jgi:hypothetical protein